MGLKTIKCGMNIKETQQIQISPQVISLTQNPYLALSRLKNFPGAFSLLQCASQSTVPRAVFCAYPSNRHTFEVSQIFC